MTLISLSDNLAIARKKHFAIGAFNAVDSNFVDSIFMAAERANSPVIVNIAEVHLRKIHLEDIASYVLYKAKETKLPVTVNLDHGMTIPIIERALKAGFTSIMFDGSHLEYEENVKQTQHVVGMCRSFGASVEGELGAVGGDEGGALYGEANEALYTPIDLAENYVSRTKVDALAVAIGNSHGRYSGTPKLDFERLSTLNEALKIPLVLHGGSGLSIEDFQKSIQLGIAKINFFTGMSQSAIQTIEKQLVSKNLAIQYDHYLLMMSCVQEAIAKVVEEQMTIFGSKNQRDAYGK